MRISLLCTTAAALLAAMVAIASAQATRSQPATPQVAPGLVVPAPPAELPRTLSPPAELPRALPQPQFTPAPAVTVPPPGPPAKAQRVRNTPDVSCSDWLRACRRRGGTVAACTEQRDACISTTGCFTEEARFGGETFCQLRRQ